MDQVAAEAYCDGAGEDRFHRTRPAVALLLCAIGLTAIQYAGTVELFHQKVAPVLPEVSAVWAARLPHIWWSGWKLLGYVGLPCVAIWAMGGRVRDHGASIKGLWKYRWMIGIPAVIVCVVVFFMARSPGFSEFYPIYGSASDAWSELLAWELIYLPQFFALEFFFRGYLLKVLTPAMGRHAIYVTMIPYCMIHFHKPLGETLVSIVAGVLFATLAVRTRSFWTGALIHACAGLSMDIFALYHGGGFPTRW